MFHVSNTVQFSVVVWYTRNHSVTSTSLKGISAMLGQRTWAIPRGRNIVMARKKFRNLVLMRPVTDHMLVPGITSSPAA